MQLHAACVCLFLLPKSFDAESMPNAKELPADAFVESVVDVLISSKKAFTLLDAKKLLTRSISKLPEGKAKATAQAQLPVLKRLLRKKLIDILPEPRTDANISVGSAQAFVAAARTGNKLSGLLQARLAAHPALLERVLSQQEGATFDESILHLIASSDSPDVGHVIVHACQRYSSELRQMAGLSITTQSRQGRKKSSATSEQALYFAPIVDAGARRLAELSEALQSIAALCPLHGLPRSGPAHCILHNACQPPPSPIATLMFTAAAAHTLARLQHLQETCLTTAELRQTLTHVQQHVRELASGLQANPAEVGQFLLQHPVAAIDSCVPSHSWAAVPCIAWLAVHTTVACPQLRTAPFLNMPVVLLQRRCAQRHACLGDTAAAEKAMMALSGRPCSAAACSWMAGLQQPARLMSACQRQDACHPGKLCDFLLRYPDEEDIFHLQQLVLQSDESAPAAAAADTEQGDDALFVLDAQAEPVFTGAWSAPDASANEDEGSDQVRGQHASPQQRLRGAWQWLMGMTVLHIIS